jgi:hypothetical protein
LYFVEWYSIAQETIRLVCDFIVVYNKSVRKDERILINRSEEEEEEEETKRMEGATYHTEPR